MLHNLFVIGEAVRSVPDGVKEKYAAVEWQQINALRNIIAHEYFGVKLETVWNIVEAEVPRLRAEMERILADLDAQGPAED